jgi:TLD
MSLKIVFHFNQWRRLYSSNHDGFSFRTFANALVSYKGPTIILIQTTSQDKIGFATDCPWKFSNHWYGDHADSFLFTMNPIAFYHPITGTGKAFQYLNLPPSYRNRDLRGLAIGGISQDCPRLHLTESMEACIASAVDVTFENGPLLCDSLKSHFDVSLLEVFAVNATDVQYQHFRKHGEQELALQEAKRIQSAKVDKTQFIEDFLAGTVPNDLFGHRAHTSGRHEFHQNKDS